MITKEYLQQELAKRIDGYKRGVETSTDNIIAEMKSILVLVDALPDYEKKYNEALKRAKAVMDVAANQDEAKGIATTIFPELRESEDERIRKYLIEELKAAKSVGELKFVIPQPTREECIAYLEKQKEQKPAEWEDYKDKVNIPYCSSEPEWSEEDERIMESLISLIETIGEYYISLETIDRYVTWLKSLRPRPSWKPREEQMSALLWCIAHLGGADRRVLAELYEHLKMYCK